MIYENISLKEFNTFGLDYNAGRLVEANSEEEAAGYLRNSDKFKKPYLILGGGSNILFTHDFNGTIFHPTVGGITIEREDRTSGEVWISAGAGVEWDKFVEWSVMHGFSGIENLSLIPGKVGATPVQNIGAYGAEIKNNITEVQALSVRDGSRRIFSNQECEFGYRNSIFKNREKGNYLVVKVLFRLSLQPVTNLCYGSLKEEVSKIGDITPSNVRHAVINIRQSKLPDPKIVGNAGSFFKNPVVSATIAEKLKSEYESIPMYDEKEGHKKLAAGWLIEKCGWKGVTHGNAGVHDKQALVLVNHGNATGTEIYELSEEIRKSVLGRFGINLEREVEVF